MFPKHRRAFDVLASDVIEACEPACEQHHGDVGSVDLLGEPFRVGIGSREQEQPVDLAFNHGRDDFVLSVGKVAAVADENRISGVMGDLVHGHCQLGKVRVDDLGNDEADGHRPALPQVGRLPVVHIAELVHCFADLQGGGLRNAGAAANDERSG